MTKIYRGRRRRGLHYMCDKCGKRATIEVRNAGWHGMGAGKSIIYTSDLCPECHIRYDSWLKRKPKTKPKETTKKKTKKVKISRTDLLDLDQ